MRRTKSVRRLSDVIPKSGIRMDKERLSNKIKAKTLNKLARRDRLISPLPAQIKEINSNITIKMVCSPKGKANSLIRNETIANTSPIGTMSFHLRGILLITKAKVTKAICSGIP